MQRCTCCNARMGDAGICPRCQTDFSHAQAAELAAQYFLAVAIQYCRQQHLEQCLKALQHSLHLHQSRLAARFRDFLIHQHSREILDLLAKQQVPAAKQRLFKLRLLLPHSELLQQLHAFTDYLLLNHDRA